GSRALPPARRRSGRVSALGGPRAGGASGGAHPVRPAGLGAKHQCGGRADAGGAAGRGSRPLARGASAAAALARRAPAHRRAHVGRIRSGMVSLERLISSFLEFTRPAAARPAPLDLAALTREAALAAVPLSRERGAVLRVSARRAAPVSGDRERLLSAVSN